MAADAGTDLPVEIRRSARRRRTVSARLEEGRLVVLMPAGLTRAQEQEWVERMRAKVVRRRRAPASDAALAARATELSRAYLDGRARPTSVRWVTNQHGRWGSATPAQGTIRISVDVAPLPAYVRDYVLLHELTHLLVPDHGPRFWAWLQAYPQLERARGYLDGYAAARARNAPASDARGGEGGAGHEAGGRGESSDAVDDVD